MILLDVHHVFIHVDEDGLRRRLLTIDMEADDAEPFDVFARVADSIASRKTDRIRHEDAQAAVERAYARQERRPGQPVHADADLPWGGYVRVGRMTV